MPYDEYNGQCTGRVLYFLHKYLPNEADHVKIGAGDVVLYGEKIGSYRWHFSRHVEFATDVPIFSFNEQYKFAEESQSIHIIDLLKKSWRCFEQTQRGNWSRLGILSMKLPFNRFKSMVYSVYFDTKAYTFHIFNDVLGEMEYQYFSPVNYQIEREAKFRASIELFGIHEFKELR